MQKKVTLKKVEKTYFLPYFPSKREKVQVLQWPMQKPKRIFLKTIQRRVAEIKPTDMVNLARTVINARYRK